MKMKSDLSIFLGRLFGGVLVYLGVVLMILIAIGFNGWVGLIVGGGLIIYGFFLRFKAGRRYGYILYQGGRI